MCTWLELLANSETGRKAGFGAGLFAQTGLTVFNLSLPKRLPRASLSLISLFRKAPESLFNSVLSSERLPRASLTVFLLRKAPESLF